MIKRYFLDYHALSGSMTIDLASGNIQVHHKECEDWIVHLIDTGLLTNTGGRVRRLRPYLDGETFMVTYGDGVADIDIARMLAFHQAHGRTATVTAVRPPARFGGLGLNGDEVVHFVEKPQIGEGWINGGFLAFEPSIFQLLRDDSSVLEVDALESLAAANHLAAYRHDGFWQCMDTLRDVRSLQSLWSDGNAPWKVWN